MYVSAGACTAIWTDVEKRNDFRLHLLIIENVYDHSIGFFVGRVDDDANAGGLHEFHTLTANCYCCAQGN